MANQSEVLIMRIGQATLNYLRESVTYPATGEQIKSACGMMATIPPEERQLAFEWIRSRRLYLSAAEAIDDLQLCDGQASTLYGGHAGPYIRFSRISLMP